MVPPFGPGYARSMPGVRAVGLAAALLAVGCGETLGFHSELEPIRDAGPDMALFDARPDKVTPPVDAPVPDAPPDVPVEAPPPTCVFDPGTAIPEGGAPTGPVHYWPLESSPVPGAAFDVVGNAAGAEIGGLTLASGQVGMAYEFDGQSYIRFGNAVNLDAKSFSVHLWYRNTAADDAEHTLLSKGVTGSGNPPSGGYALRLRQGQVDWAVSDSGVALTAAAAEPARNVWHHVTGVLDRAECRLLLYVDGARVAETPFQSLGSIETNVRFAIGAVDRNPGSPVVNQYFVGDLDEIAVFLRALDASEVERLHQRGLAQEPIFP
jgi:hypothetical protein